MDQASPSRPLTAAPQADTPRARTIARIDRFLAGRVIPTPFLIVDLETVRETFRALHAAFPAATIFYAVKANPSPAVIAALADCGAHFDLASEGEISRCLDLGIAAERLSFGNTIKREAEIARAHQSGIDLFAFDSIAELEKLARAAPGARVFCRMLVETKGAEWPLTRKFGCTPAMASDLLPQARKLGLKPVGVSFHVGSQQTDPQQWAHAIAAAAAIFQACAHKGLRLDLLNLGGGFPAHYRHHVPMLATYAETIETALQQHFGANRPHIVIEPGRGLVGDAGLLRSEVLLVARKTHRAPKPWVYLDAGRFNGLPETFGERIQYEIRCSRPSLATMPAILAGPSCDSVDILYEHADYHLPLDLRIGDTLDFLSAGAYTASYASVEFNGFAPIKTYCV